MTFRSFHASLGAISGPIEPMDVRVSNRACISACMHVVILTIQGV